MKKIVNVTSDGAAVLIGKISGVWAQLNHHFSIFNVQHDGAHKVNLISQEVLNNIS